MQGGHVEQWREGHASYYTVIKEIAAGFMKTLDLHTCAIKQNRGSSGECICIIEQKSWQLLHFVCREGAHGGHAEQGGHVERWCG